MRLIVFILASLLAAPAWAETAPSTPPASPARPLPAVHPVDMTRVILDTNHRPMPDGSAKEPDDKDCAHCPKLTVGRVVALALNANFPDEQNLGWQQRFDRSTLAQRVENDSTAVLDSSETATIERLIGKLGLNGLVLLQVIQTIDPNAKAGKVN